MSSKYLDEEEPRSINGGGVNGLSVDLEDQRYFGLGEGKRGKGKRPKSLGQRAVALGQPVGPTAREVKPRRDSGLDWLRIRSSWFELNVELSVYA